MPETRDPELRFDYSKAVWQSPLMRFQVTGYFLIEDGKIRIWRDFSYPGSKQLIEPAPKA